MLTAMLCRVFTLLLPIVSVRSRVSPAMGVSGSVFGLLLTGRLREAVEAGGAARHPAVAR